MQYRTLITKFLQYSGTTQLPVNYNSVVIINQGTTIIKLDNSVSIPAGGSMSWAHNQNEINVTPITLSFANTNDAGNLAVCVYTYYTDNPLKFLR